MLAMAALTAVGQTYHVAGMTGGNNIFVGSSSYAQLDHGWHNFIPVTMASGSTRVVAPGHTFVNDEVLQFAAPGGTLPPNIAYYRAYQVCDVDPGVSFTIVPRASADCRAGYSRVQFSNAGSGVMATRGTFQHHDVYISETIEGLPVGVSVEILCGDASCFRKSGHPGFVYSYRGNAEFKFRINASPSAQIGKATLKFSLYPGGPSGLAEVVEFPINIQPFVPVTEAKYTTTWAVPKPLPIPGIEKWETVMSTLGAKWCPFDKPEPIMAFGADTQVWYYDGASVYFEMFDYTGDPHWRNCALNIAKQYRDYVLRNNGGVPAYRVFTDGLMRAEKETGDPSFGAAVEALALRGQWRNRISVSTTTLREVSYYLRALVAQERRDGVRSPRLQRNAELLFGMFDMLFVMDSDQMHQVWMDGLALRALVDYHSITKDPKAIRYVKLAVDWIWEKAQVAGSAGLMTNVHPLGPRCDWGCRTTSTELINLIAPAYAWLWAVTGDPVYRSRGDYLFSSALNTDISYSGKIFSQNYTWSFAYVKWRKLIPGYHPVY